MALPRMGQDGFNSYHEEATWGIDIPLAIQSLGIGN
jgi:hypothetical protein